MRSTAIIISVFLLVLSQRTLAIGASPRILPQPKLAVPVTQHVLTKTKTKDLVATAREYLATGAYGQPQWYGEPQIWRHRDFAVLTFRQMREGRSVINGRVSFRFSKDRLVQIVDASWANATVQPALFTDTLKTKFATGEHLFLATTRGTLTPVLRVVAKTPWHANETILLDEHTGKELSRHSGENLHKPGVATASVLAHNPQSEEIVLPLARLQIFTPNREAAITTTNFDGEFASTEMPGLRELTGQRASVSRFGAALPFFAGVDLGDSWQIDWRFATAQPSEQVAMMAYVHLDQVAAAFAALDADPPHVPASVDHPGGCNAGFDGERILFQREGSACHNPALFADIIYHEWTHALDQRWGGITDRALAEGLADSVAATMTQSPLIGGGFWRDGRPAIRDLTIDYHYPEQAGALDPHDEGRIIGSTLWDLYSALRSTDGDTAARRLHLFFLAGIVTSAEHYLEVYDLLLALDAHYYATEIGISPHACQINSEFANHGLAAIDRACIDFRLDAGEWQDGNNQIAEPGESGVWTVTATNARRQDLPAFGLPLAGDGLRFFGPLTFADGIGARERAVSELAAQVSAEARCGSRLNVSDASGDHRLTLRVGRLVGETETYTLPVTELADQSETRLPVLITSEQWQADTTVHALHGHLAITHPFPFEVAVDLLHVASGLRVPLYRPKVSDLTIAIDFDLTASVQDAAGGGEWLLVISDAGAGDVGTLTQFSLSATPSVYECD